jgi:septum formation protein
MVGRVLRQSCCWNAPQRPARIDARLFHKVLRLSLILASTSPIRRQILSAAGVEFETAKPCVEEAEVKSGTTGPEQIATQLAAAKATSVKAAGWAIGSDSVVSIGDRLFDKPASREEAIEHLRFFSGKSMRLTSSVALAHGAMLDWVHTDAATLQVRPLGDPFIAAYLDAEWPEVGYCVGVFRLEGRGVQLFEWIDGDHFTILGMPLLPLLGALRARGLMPS